MKEKREAKEGIEGGLPVIDTMTSPADCRVYWGTWNPTGTLPSPSCSMAT